MKLFAIVFFLSINLSAFSKHIIPDSIFTDTAYFRNGRPHYIIDYCLIDNGYVNCGKYEYYDTSGTVLIKGQYKISEDSLECVDCYFVNQFDSSYTQYFNSACQEIRTGVWYFYHPNGTIKEQGSYSEKVHEEWSIPMVRGPVGYSCEHLKHGPWYYYDSEGNLTSKVWYFEGRVIQTAHP